MKDGSSDGDEGEGHWSLVCYGPPLLASSKKKMRRRTTGVPLAGGRDGCTAAPIPATGRALEN